LQKHFLAARAVPPPPTKIDRRAAADTMTSAHGSTPDAHAGDIGFCRSRVEASVGVWQGA